LQASGFLYQVSTKTRGLQRRTAKKTSGFCIGFLQKPPFFFAVVYGKTK